MYTKEVRDYSLFISTPVTVYFKDGKVVGRKQDGVMTLTPSFADNTVELTRAQGYRYWGKHFPNLPCYCLPDALREAINKEPWSCGAYFDRKRGEWVGYSG